MYSICLKIQPVFFSKVSFGGVQEAILEQAKDPVLIALRKGVQWQDSLSGILQEVVKGQLATWDNGITTRLLVAVQFTDNTGQPLVHFPGFHLLQERIAWPLQQHAPYKPRCVWPPGDAGGCWERIT